MLSTVLKNANQNTIPRKLFNLLFPKSIKKQGKVLLHYHSFTFQTDLEVI